MLIEDRQRDEEIPALVNVKIMLPLLNYEIKKMQYEV
jgi:hypothetical protein